MDKDQIAQIAKNIKTKDDLFHLLNQIKYSMMAEAGTLNKFHPFLMKHINYFCNPNNTSRRFKQFKIKKKTGALRIINTPHYRSYMTLLKCVNIMLKSIYTPSEFAMGFTEGKSMH